MNITIEFYIFELVSVPSFSLNWQFFDPKFPKKVIPGLKQKKWTPLLNCAYSKKFRYEISAETDNLDFLDQICSQRVFLVEDRKNEHHHWILHIRIILNTQFQLKLMILIFWTKFTQKWYFRSKTEKVKATWFEPTTQMVEYSFTNSVVVGSNHVAVTETSDMAPGSSKEFLDIQANYRVWISSEIRTWHDNNIQRKWTLPFNSAYSN